MTPHAARKASHFGPNAEVYSAQEYEALAKERDTWEEAYASLNRDSVPKTERDEWRQRYWDSEKEREALRERLYESEKALISGCPVCRRPLNDDEVMGSCASTKGGSHRRVQSSQSDAGA